MRILRLASLLLALATSTASGDSADPPPQATGDPSERPPPVVSEDLGNGRYRVGAIEVDQARGRFSVSARVIRDEPPLEFLAVTRGGAKAYESLLEVPASAFEFNLACILLGLDPERSKPPRTHFDPLPAVGDAVSVEVAWRHAGEERRVEAASLLRVGGETGQGDWVYTGSIVLPDGRYLAHLDGTAIGFVHDPSSIIEHRTGIGIGQFGRVTVDPDLLPPVGSEVQLVVSRVVTATDAEPGEAPTAPRPSGSDPRPPAPEDADSP